MFTRRADMMARVDVIRGTGTVLQPGVLHLVLGVEGRTHVAGGAVPVHHAWLLEDAQQETHVRADGVAIAVFVGRRRPERGAVPSAGSPEKPEET